MTTRPECKRERAAVWFARCALAAGFLSSVAARFGFWGSRSSWSGFADFIAYTQSVLGFMPSASIPFFAWAATVAEAVLGVALVCPGQLKWSARGSAALLFSFAMAMTISLGIKEPLDYSVFTASAAAVLLAVRS